jgi:hypothetical protein
MCMELSRYELRAVNSTFKYGGRFTPCYIFCVFASKCESWTLSSLRVFAFSDFRGKEAKTRHGVSQPSYSRDSDIKKPRI